MMHSNERVTTWNRAIAAWLCMAVMAGPLPLVTAAASEASGQTFDDGDDGDFARKHDLLSSPDWQRAVAELAGWLLVQRVYPPAEVRRIKARFNDRVASMSSYELEYLLDSIAVKMRLLETPQAADAKAWLGEYLSAMTDARRAREMRDIPNILEMSADDLWREILRIDALRAQVQTRQRGVDSKQSVLAERAAAGRASTAAASQAAASRARSAPSHSPYRAGPGKTPFADYQPRRMQIVVGGMF